MNGNTRLLTLLLALTVTLFGCSVDLSHKHYSDEFGVCRSCGEDTAILLAPDGAGGYSSGEVRLTAAGEVIFRFTAGEAEVAFSLVEGSADAEDGTLSLYRKGAYGLSLLYHYEEDIYRPAAPLAVGEVYYLSLRVKTPGTLTLTAIPHVK